MAAPASPTALAADPAGATTTTAPPRLPWLQLLVLGSTTFVALVSEMLPAGLLTPMARDLSVSESGAGQLVTVYAVAAGVTAIPLIGLTRSVSRFRMLLVVVAGFAVVNALTALTSSYELMLVVRVFGGIVTGLIWSMVGGYAAAIVPEELRGRALAIALGGASVGFTVGVPLSAGVGALVGWRAAFAGVAVIGLAGLIAAAIVLPRVPGEPPEDREPFFSVLRRPGVLSIAGVTVTLIVGHYTLYTYIDPFVQRAGLENGVGLALMMFGGGTLIGMLCCGPFIDRDLRRTLFVALGVIAAALLTLGLLGTSAVVVVAVCLPWGIAYGTLTPLMQTAAVRAGGAAADVAVSVTVTAWSLGIGAGAVAGGIAFDARGAGVLPWTALALTLVAIAGVVVARRGFPPPRDGATVEAHPRADPAAV